MAVARLVATVPHTSYMLAAAWLHDVVEDTPITQAEIEAVFGREISELVEYLTDVSRPDDGNRKIRKALDREHTANSSPDAKTVKLADLVDNSKSITNYDPNWARIYLKEKRSLLEVLEKGHPNLMAKARQFCQ